MTFRKEHNMKKLTLSIIILTICSLLLPTTVGSALGGAALPMPIPLMDETSFTFTQLREEEIRMFGPFATETMLFGVPANWLLLEGAQLELDMTVAIQTAASLAAESGSSVYGGALTVVVNENIIAVLPLNNSGLTTSVVPIPLQALQSVREDGRIEVAFLLSSSQACLVDQKMDIVIHASSRFTIPHEITQPDTSLMNFPRPLYQDSVFLDSARIVIPDQPTASELQAALTVAAGLQARTGNSMLLDVVSSNGLTEDKLADSHIIIVGNAGSFPVLYQLLLPMALNEGKFTDAGDSGILQMVVSPWSPERVVLVVSGNDDQATVKAAQALSTGVIRSNTVPNLALISNVNSRAAVNQSSVDQTLADLGYESVAFENRGESAETFQFYIPTGQTVTPEAYFEVSLSNSALLNYDRSGLFVLLNDIPIGSVRLSDETSNQPNNRVRIPIPPSAIRSGLNFLDVAVSLEPLEECADPNQAGLFVTLWNDSRLYLPLVQKPVNAIDIPDLGTYPAPFVQIPELGNIAFVLERDNFESWRYAIQIAADLGSIADGVIFTPTAFYADEIPEAARSLYNMLIIGIPSKMKIISEINDKLPAPFESGSDLASESELQVIYQIDPQIPAGYLELLPSPWNPENLIVTVLGNSSKGVSWAGDALLEEITRPKLLGNFAVVTDEQVIAVDTRLFKQSSSPELVPTALPANTTDTEAAAQPSSKKPSTSTWVLIALVLTVLLIILVIGIAVYLNRKGKR
jgi:hypothetical protein